MNNMTATEGCDASRQSKYSDLLQIDHRLTDVIQHLEDLNSRLGVNRPSTPVDDPPKTPKTPTLDTLVSVLNALTTMVNCKVEHIHNLLNDLEQDLI